LGDVRFHNDRNGFCWFSQETMKFFGSKIESSLLKGGYFITSEKNFDGTKRLYSIRKVNEDFSIDTIGSFQQFTTKNLAKKYIKENTNYGEDK
jgi:hypothetical protein